MANRGMRQQAFDDIDDASAALILQMQREDVDELLASSKGKKRKREESDSELAMAMFREDLQDLSAVIADRSISRSMTRAVLTDAALLHESVAEERSATDDRAMAWQLAGRRIRRTDTANTRSGLPVLEESLSARLLNQYVAPLPDADNGTANHVPIEGKDGRQSIGDSSSWLDSTQARTACTPHHCVCCETLSPLFKLLFAPCGHYYCEECLQRLFRLSTSDETLFPPRCCQQDIPLTPAKLYLGSELIEQFQKKSLEFSTPDRTYCHRQTCSAFIPPQSIQGGRGNCPECGSSTCKICKGQSHTGNCPQDRKTQQVLDLAEAEGWQRCSNCRRLVELHHGCNHITCICRFEFCYVCGLEWKTCRCAQWNEDHLLARAERMVDREQPVPGRVHQPRAQRLDQAVQDLRDDHECNHEAWHTIGGTYQCEECEDELYEYIHECDHCFMRVCNRCRMNRL